MTSPPADRCPRCGSEKIVPIVYGYPTDKLFEAAARGEVELGGCVLFDENPQRCCKDCGKRF